MLLELQKGKKLNANALPPLKKLEKWYEEDRK